MTFNGFAVNAGASFASNPMNIVSGSVILAWAGKGTLTGLRTPTDSAGNTYSPLLTAHNYAQFANSGMNVYAATGVTGGSGVVLSEPMPDNSDEVTFSIIEVRGGRIGITNAVPSETSAGGPIVTASITTSGPAVLVSTWWGESNTVQDHADPSAGWAVVHELNSSFGAPLIVQECMAARVVSAAGTYFCSWTSSPDQGAVAYIVSVE